MPEIKATTAKLVTAFAAVYLIWGSTYLAIRYAIETLPPLLMASARFLAGGSILYFWSRMQGAPAGSRKSWKDAFIIGMMLLFFGNGAVVLAEQWVPSGLTAVLVASVPLWVSLLGWLVPGGQRPTAQVAIGILLGLFGVTLLIGVGSLRGAGTVDPFGAAVLLFGSMSWAAGSLYGRKTHISDSPIQASGMQMMGGGTFLLAAGLASGELSRFDPGGVSAHSILALVYLALFGSIIGFTAYSWLLKATTPTRAATYAYVNPAVAVLLGWAIAGEPLTPRMVFSMCIIVAAVMVITMAKRPAA
jgi:drug/metabolite transporter (DMT)-like permease